MTPIHRAIVSMLAWAFVGCAFVREWWMTAGRRRSVALIATGIALSAASGYMADRIGQETCGAGQCCRDCKTYASAAMMRHPVCSDNQIEQISN